MSWIARLFHAMRSKQVDREIDEELRFHLDSRVRDGMTPAEARRALGGYDRTFESTRDANRLPWLEDILRDIRYAVRTLRASPIFTMTVIASLALGIGANTAVFTLLRASLWRPLSVPSPEQLVQLARLAPGATSDGAYSYVVFRELRQAASGQSDVAATTGYGIRPFGTDSSSPERIIGEAVSGNFFQVLGIQPAIGRLIGSTDDSPAGGSPVAVLSYAFWSRRFQSDPSVLGRTIWFRELPYTVIGVAPAQFHGVDAEVQVDLWAPISAEAPRAWLVGPHYNWLRLIARVQPGASRSALQGSLDSVFIRHMERDVLPSVSEPHRSAIARHHLILRDAPSGLATTGRRYREPLLVLLGLVGLILLISCANVANLILARHAGRAREFAMRMALGAGRGRIAGQLFAESLLLVAAGASLGAWAAIPACRGLIALLPPSNPPVTYQLRPDAAILLFTLTVAAAVAGVFGLVPAIGTARTTLATGARATWNPRAARVLVSGQLALSLVLLILSARFVGILRGLEAVDLGFQPRGLIAFSLSIPKEMPQTRSRQIATHIRERLEQTAGVAGVAVSWPGLFAAGGWSTPVERADGQHTRGSAEEVGALGISADFFRVAGIGLTNGRYPTTSDLNAPVIWINERLARDLFGGEPAVGRRIRVPQNQPEVREVAGVVRDVNHYDAHAASWKMVYFPRDREGSFLVRSNSDLGRLAAAIRTTVAEAGGGVQMEKLRTVEDTIQGTLGRERLVATLSAAFGALATLLAAIGLYGLLSYAISRRTAEMGVRMALGATPSDVHRLVLRETCRLLMTGGAVGLLGAVITTRILSARLFGGSATAPDVFLTGSTILAVSALLAGFLPARRAARIDPATALRRN